MPVSRPGGRSRTRAGTQFRSGRRQQGPRQIDAGDSLEFRGKSLDVAHPGLWIIEIDAAMAPADHQIGVDQCSRQPQYTTGEKATGLDLPPVGEREDRAK